MPDQQDVILVTIKIDDKDVVKVAENVKELRLAAKQYADEFVQGNKDAAKSLAAVKEKLEDIKDAAKTVKGVGLEQATSSFQLLGESVKNLDFDKFKTALGGLKGALASTGILLLVQGVTYLIENFDSLSKGSGFLAKALRAIGDVISAIKDGFLFLTDAIGLTNTALDKQGEAIKKNADAATAALNAQTAAYDRQISVAKAAGKNTVELEQAKQRAIIATNLEIARQIEAFVRAGGELDAEKSKLLSASLEAIRNAKAQEQIITLTDYKKKEDDYKKHLDEMKKINDQSEKDIQAAVDKVEDARVKRVVQQNSDLAKRKSDQKIQEDKDAADQIKAEDDASAGFDALTQKEIAKTKKAEADKAAVKLQIQQQTFAGIQNLSDFFFQEQINAAGGNKEKLAKIAEEQFNVNKALQLAQATITGIQSTFNAYTSTLAIPVAGPELAPFAAAAAGVFAAAQIAKIAASKFNSAATTGSGSSGSAPSLPPPAPLPQIAAPRQVINQQPVNGQVPINITAQVVETQLTSTQALVNRLIRRSRF